MATSSQVVFDFDSEETTAVMRLCAFAQVEGNVNKVATVKVEHTQQGLYWYVTTPQAFENGQHKWAGYTNMVMPKGQDIMPGIYKIVYEDLQQEEGQSSFSVYYPKELVTATACDALKYMGSGYRVRIVLYDKNQTMIYCDTKRNQWYNTADILRDYPTALTYRYYYTASTGKYSCLMPIKSITQFE